ncbi:MAG TPA: hypothetical protein VG963_20670 [Polyangiaceae bacterium]|nr:hypothetical protein [Polyangiaceae bacterium]
MNNRVDRPFSILERVDLDQVRVNLRSDVKACLLVVGRIRSIEATANVRPKFGKNLLEFGLHDVTVRRTMWSKG